MNCCPHCTDADTFFGPRAARRDLKRYRRRGPLRSTQLLLDAVRPYAPGATLLDIGGGVGAIQHELIDAGLTRAVQVDASIAYLEASEAEANRRGTRQRISYHHGDFLDLADEVPDADLVTLDRVICCYPEMERLVTAAATKTRQKLALVFPQETTITRLGIGIGNAYFRFRRSAFRTFVHSTDAVTSVVRESGFHPVGRSGTLIWQVHVFARS